MRIQHDEARQRLANDDHGVLGTVHAERGVDLVPVVYVVDADGFVGIPIDLVKAKLSSNLQRERNLDADPRATLLIEGWDHDDWSKLWWVRAELRWLGTEHPRSESLADALAGRYAQYADRPFARVCVFEVAAAIGWRADDTTPRAD